MRIHVFESLAIALVLVPWGLTQDQQKNPLKSNRAGEQWAYRNAKVTNGPVVRSLSGTTVLITWSTNIGTDTFIRYGTDSNKLDRVGESPWGGLTHRVQLHNLAPNTTYYYRVDTSAVNGSEPLSGIAGFSTR
jgi:hypothetical protein